MEIRDFDFELLEGQPNFIPLNGLSFHWDVSGKRVLLGGKLRVQDADATIEKYVNAIDAGELPRFFFKNEFGETIWFSIHAMRKSYLDDMPIINIVCSALSI